MSQVYYVAGMDDWQLEPISHGESPWRCDYCDSANAHLVLRCTQCGGPRAKGEPAHYVPRARIIYASDWFTDITRDEAGKFISAVHDLEQKAGKQAMPFTRHLADALSKIRWIPNSE